MAAERGHKVILTEAEARLGGQALLAQMLPGRAEFGGIVTNLAREAEQAGAEIRLNARADRAMVDQIAPDHVILATGAQPRWPRGLEIDEAAHAVEIYNHGCAVDCGRGGGFHTAELMISRGRKMMLIATDDAHFNTPDAFGGWVMVKAEANEPEALLAAHRLVHYGPDPAHDSGRIPHLPAAPHPAAWPEDAPQETRSAA